MAHISRYPYLRHYRGTPTRYVIHLVGGRLRHQGAGQSFFYRASNTALSEVPVDDRELPVLFHARTADFQDVTVQLTVTFRFAEPVTVAQRLDFGIDPDTGATTSVGLDQVAHIVAELARSACLDTLATLDLAAALSIGLTQVRETLALELVGPSRLTEMGIAVLGVHVLDISPEADVGRALQTPVREALQAEADRATYERRALAVERERSIAENELANQIELATRREALVAQEGANARRQAQESAAAGEIEARAQAERLTIGAKAAASEIETRGKAEAGATAALMDAYTRAGAGVLTALALREAAENLPEIGSLTVTPDLLAQLAGHLTGRIS